jgi:hypothetical protein
MLYYKITDIWLRSFLNIHPDIWGDRDFKSWSVQYKIGEFVTPQQPNSKLYVFKTLEDAKYFVRHFGQERFHIYSCEVKNPSKNILLVWYSNIYDFKRLWNNIKNKKKYKHLVSNHIPENTVMCDAVKLLEKIV